MGEVVNRELSKEQVLKLLLQRTTDEFLLAVESQRRSQEAATHEESKPENDKDTRAVESSYLARGQAERVASLEAAVTLLRALKLRDFAEADELAVGALVWVSDSGSDSGPDQCFFLAPAGGGGALDVQGTKVQPITPHSPVGRALLSKRIGDAVEFRAPSGLKEWTIEHVK